MGGNIPMEDLPSSYFHFHPSCPSIYPALTLSFHVAWMVILVAIIGGLCGNRSNKTPSPNEGKETENTTTDENAISASATESNSPLQTTTTTTTTTADQEEIQKPLAPPPAAVALELGGDGERKKSPPPPQIDRSSTLHTYMSKKKSRRKLSGSISMRISGAKSIRQRVVEMKDLNREDSIWQKKILLGEKCRLQSGDDEDGDGASAALGSRGTASEAGSSHISAASAAMTRTNSLIEGDAVSSCKEEMEKERMGQPRSRH